MDGLLLDKIHNSLEACFSVDERIGEKVWAAVVGLLDGFLDISRQEVFFHSKHLPSSSLKGQSGLFLGSTATGSSA